MNLSPEILPEPNDAEHPATRSVTSPDFRYSPSRNIYWEKIAHPTEGMEGLAFTDHDTETHRGSWRKEFRASAEGNELPPLHVEIGCNAGHVCLEWAKQNPNQRYIGIDWKFKAVFRLAEKIHKSGVKNLIAFRSNAERLPQMFAEREIDFLHMFFPDPWPKKAQMKNRTANETWLRSIAPLISNQGHFHLKTDHAEYFQFILEEIEKLIDVYEVLEMTKDLHAKHPDPKSLKIPEVTLFEKLFIKDGLPIHSVKLKPIRH
jgi:tRNA (guanine-N(7)-)-methyltransferase